MSSLSSASVVDLLLSFLVQFDRFALCLCLYLAGLVVCAKDGLDVDLLVSSSLDGWEEESDLCVRSEKVKNKTRSMSI